MFINITIKPEINGVVWCYGGIKIKDGNTYMESIVGRVEKIKDEYVKLYDIDRLIPYYAITGFTFGGIQVKNKEFDIDKLNKMWEKEYNEIKRRKSK